MNRVELERKYWEEKAKAKDVDREMHDPWLSTEEEVKIILSEMPKDAESILEIGCGVGRLIVGLDLFLRERNITGIDISKSLIELAKIKTSITNFNTINFEECDGRSLPNKKYDFIYSVTVFQHIDFAGVCDYVKEVGDKLRKDGRFLFQFIEGIEHEPMSHHFWFTDIAKILRLSGMEIINVQKGLIHPSWTWITAKKL